MSTLQTQAPTWPDRTRTEELLLQVVWRSQDADGYNASQAELAGEIGVSARQVRNLVKQLAAAGLLLVRGGPGEILSLRALPPRPRVWPELPGRSTPAPAPAPVSIDFYPELAAAIGVSEAIALAKACALKTGEGRSRRVERKGLKFDSLCFWWPEHKRLADLPFLSPRTLGRVLERLAGPLDLLWHVTPADGYARADWFTVNEPAIEDLLARCQRRPVEGKLAQQLAGDRTLTSAEKLLLGVLLSHPEADGWITLPYSRLAAELGKHANHIKRTVRLLERRYRAGRTAWCLTRRERAKASPNDSAAFRICPPSDALPGDLLEAPAPFMRIAQPEPAPVAVDPAPAVEEAAQIAPTPLAPPVQELAPAQAPDPAEASPEPDKRLRKSTRKRAHLVDPDALAQARARAPQLFAWVDEWADRLAALGRSAQHVREHRNEAAAVIALSGASSPATLTESALIRGLGVIRARRGGGTVESHRRAIQAFGTWASRPAVGYLPSNPAHDIPSYKPSADRRHERTAFTDQQLSRLLAVTAASRREFRGISGRDRAELYHAAAVTGLREECLGKLTVGQFHLADGFPRVEVRADQQKARKALTVPIQADASARLRRYFKGKAPEALAFRIPLHKPAVVLMLKADLEEAGITYCREVVMDNGQTRREEVLDFHALRVTFGSRCGAAGVPLTVTQQWMGHSDPRLTANTYSKTSQADAAAAVAKLPAIKPDKRCQL